MREIEVKRLPHVTDQYLRSLNGRHGAQERDCETLIDEDVLIKVDGKPRMVYLSIKGKIQTEALRWACINTKYNRSDRTSGLVTNSRTFGYMPRRAIMADYCHESDVRAIGAKPSLIFKNFSRELEQYYQQFFPEKHAEHHRTVEEKILPEWRIKGSPFTSGIVNKDNKLLYHRDAGNFKGLYSNMVAFKKDVEGGRLCLPEFGIKFEIADESLLIFDGQEYVHGVTPIMKTSTGAYRYTVVWYSLEQMWQCLPLQEESKRIQQKKTEREKNRVELIKSRAKE